MYGWMDSWMVKANSYNWIKQRHLESYSAQIKFANRDNF